MRLPAQKSTYLIRRTARTERFNNAKHPGNQQYAHGQIPDGRRGYDRQGRCTDVYFRRTSDVLEEDGIDPGIVMEIIAASLPDRWAVFCGLNDAAALLEGVPADMDAMPEGSIFYPGEAVVRISGRCLDFAALETATLGILCHAAGVTSAAAHIQVAAAGRSTPSARAASTRRSPP